MRAIRLPRFSLRTLLAMFVVGAVVGVLWRPETSRVEEPSLSGRPCMGLAFSLANSTSSAYVASVNGTLRRATAEWHIVVFDDGSVTDQLESLVATVTPQSARRLEKMNRVGRWPYLSPSLETVSIAAAVAGDRLSLSTYDLRKGRRVAYDVRAACAAAMIQNQLLLAKRAAGESSAAIDSTIEIELGLGTTLLVNGFQHWETYSVTDLEVHAPWASPLHAEVMDYRAESERLAAQPP
ncbi:MAG: hypothetical protein AAF961_16830 [Planctomycetota bacterium]